ncbi:hypothetical protein NQ318_010821 [Aromia moschata]|uniref:Uncharacterized protein n=1 Tax=Aromia moschata TaxID=1265417 RepID=A0AAV8YI30_9CUCU|nr:hypothetical protein NQ318_010821 [Aromia moschata]
MEKKVLNLHVVLEPLTKSANDCFTPKSQRSEKQCTTPCYVKLEDIKKAETSCSVKFENANQRTEETKREIRENSMPPSNISSNTPQGASKPDKNRTTEPVTPHAHVEFSVELKKVINERNILTSKTKARHLTKLRQKRKKTVAVIKRNKALLEIINSEIKYVAQLETIINFFMKPAREQKLLKFDDFNILFGNINTIYGINKELLEELEKGFDNVVNAFFKIAPFLKLYSVYAFEFKNSIKILQNARLLNPQFAKFMENQETRPEVQNKLSALLITPIQRVPRYKLLLTNLYNLTKPSDKDFRNLSECLGKIEEAAEHINKIVEDQENMQRLLEFQRCLRSGELNVIMPGRKLLKEGILMKLPTNNIHSERIFVVLMSDIIVFSKMKSEEPKVNSLKCTSIFPLGKCKVIELLDKGCLRIICQEEEFVLYHDQFSETKKWITKIKEAIQIHVSNRKTLRKESSAWRPVKRKDIHEYHEVGLSPGRPLKKRKTAEAAESTTARKVYSSEISTSMPSETNAKVEENNQNSVKDLHVFGKPHKIGSQFGTFLGGYQFILDMLLPK